MILSVAKDFSETPGPRHREEGEFSGEEFLDGVLLPRFEETKAKGEILIVDLDGTEGYATSFLEAAFGGLARKYNPAEVAKIVKFKSDDEPFLIEEIAK